MPIRAMLQALILAALAAPPLHAAPPERGGDGSDVVGAPADADWVLARIARPAPARTPFLELRDSALLKEPLRILGEYRREAGDSLVRQVNSPYRETTTIANGMVRIERAGRAPRSFAMSRAPELAALQASFGALLAGDRARLERHYRIEVDGSRRDWALVLTPRDAALAGRVAAVTLHGRGAELRCIESAPVDGREQRSLLAGAVADAEGVDDPATLQALCHGETDRSRGEWGGSR
ncbi:LolA-related protein [Marilutibacter chinensis]|uniref:Fatty acyl CoA synthetase n=1 Tax=Marilutibacter chinensis TaxID=2912247 RepID=A0ABS9HTL9_9GAMM|nr:LolA-related protein [Lysobacter chinensis]MCF7221697.1 fatty acyl CoA synthetase [Lysobacter chinensis]